eukprot:913697_1
MINAINIKTFIEDGSYRDYSFKDGFAVCVRIMQGIQQMSFKYTPHHHIATKLNHQSCTTNERDERHADNEPTAAAHKYDQTQLPPQLLLLLLGTCPHVRRLH